MSVISGGTLHALTSIEKVPISSICILEQQRNMTGDTQNSVISDIRPPASLFSQQILDMPAIYSSFRDFCDSRGAYLQHHTSRRIKMTLETILYDEPADREPATEIVADIFSQGRRDRRVRYTSKGLFALIELVDTWS